MAISFKSFITDICNAVATASQTLKNRNRQFLESYFDKQQATDNGTGSHTPLYSPKSVFIEAPAVNDEGIAEKDQIEIPLLSLASHSSEHIEKMTLNIDLQIFIEDGELKVDLGESRKKKKEASRGTLEITISPDESPEGLQQLVSRYENIIRSQI